MISSAPPATTTRSISTWRNRLNGIPSEKTRVIVSIVLAVFGALTILDQYGSNPSFHTDFGMSWFGARSLIHGVNPYPLVGRGLQFDYRWPLTYPATSLVALLPFGFLSERSAAVIFVGVSVFLLAFGATRTGWHLIPLFVTEPFLNAVRLGQWNIALTAALFFPSLGFFSVVKPQAALPIILASRKSAIWIIAACGAVILLLVSFAILPNWPIEWLRAVGQMPDSRPPLMRFGGPLILLVLFRWRRADAWLILTLACVPQTPAFYSTLPLFTIPSTIAESVALAGIMTLGGFLGATFIPGSIASIDQLQNYIGSLHVWTIFLPCVVLVARRSNNTSESPVWIRHLTNNQNAVSLRTTSGSR